MHICFSIKDLHAFLRSQRRQVIEPDCRQAGLFVFAPSARKTLFRARSTHKRLNTSTLLSFVKCHHKNQHKNTFEYFPFFSVVNKKNKQYTSQ